MKSDKALGRPALEVTQRIQREFPDIHPKILQAWVGCPKEILMARLTEIFSRRPIPVVPPKPESLLDLVGVVNIPGMAKRKFVPLDKFAVDTRPEAPVKILYVLGAFQGICLHSPAELTPGAFSLRYQTLRENSFCEPILAELSCKGEIETTLAKIYALIELQGKGENGTLLTNGLSNIFFIRHEYGFQEEKSIPICIKLDSNLTNYQLRFASAGWTVGWVVFAPDINSTNLRAGCRVFSRDSYFLIF